jgi:hypothetical protein
MHGLRRGGVPATGGTSFPPALKDAEAFQQRALLSLKGNVVSSRGLCRRFLVFRMICAR